MSATTATAFPTAITYADGATVRVSAQTASRDYSGRVVPGTYPITWTDISGREVAPERAYYGRVRLEIDVDERRQSTVEFGGVALASETVPAHRESYTTSFYTYQLAGGLKGFADLTLVY